MGEYHWRAKVVASDRLTGFEKNLNDELERINTNDNKELGEIHYQITAEGEHSTDNYFTAVVMYKEEVEYGKY